MLKCPTYCLLQNTFYPPLNSPFIIIWMLLKLKVGAVTICATFYLLIPVSELNLSVIFVTLGSFQTFLM